MTTINHLNNFAEIDSEIQQQYSKTADELLEVEHLDLDNTEYLAKLLFCLGRYDESIEQFERILSIKCDDENVMADIGINYFKKRDNGTALKYFDNCLERDPDSESLLSYKMLSHEFLKDYGRAIECGERIIRKNSKNTSAVKRLIDYHLKLKNYEECLYYIGQIEYDDKYKKALVLYELHRFEECIEVARKIKTAESYRLVAKSYLELKNVVKAVKYLYKSYEKDFNVDMLFEISDIYFEAEEYKKSIYFLKEALLHDDSNAEIYSKIGFAYLKSDNWSDAIEYAQKALDISKKVPQAYVTLAEAHIQLELGNYEKPKEIIEEGIRENPDSPELWIERGDLNFNDDLIAFVKSYERAMELNPKDYNICLKCAKLLLLAGEVEAAKPWYNQLLLLNPLFEKSFEELQKS